MGRAWAFARNHVRDLEIQMESIASLGCDRVSTQPDLQHVPGNFEVSTTALARMLKAAFVLDISTRQMTNAQEKPCPQMPRLFPTSDLSYLNCGITPDVG